MQSHRRRGLGQKLLWAAKQHAPIFAALAVWVLVELHKGSPYGAFAWASFLALPLYGLWFIRLVLPIAVFQLILEAAVWHDWKNGKLHGNRTCRLTGRHGAGQVFIGFAEVTVSQREGSVRPAMPAPFRPDGDIAREGGETSPERTRRGVNLLRIRIAARTSRDNAALTRSGPARPSAGVSLRQTGGNG